MKKTMCDNAVCETLNHCKLVLSITGFWPNKYSRNLIINNLKGHSIALSLGILTIFQCIMVAKDSAVNITVLVE